MTNKPSTGAMLEGCLLQAIIHPRIPQLSSEALNASTWVKIVFIFTAFLSLATSVLVQGLLWQNEFVESKIEKPLLALDQTIAPCSYDQLHQVVQNKNATRDLYSTKEQCWSLSNEMLAIGTEAIVNIDNMKWLGQGAKGSVFEAIVWLPHSHFHCGIAVKTEKCYDSQRHRLTNCLGPHSYFHQSNSQLGAEWAAGLVFEASKRIKLSKEVSAGFLPTWGVVQADAPLASKIPREEQGVTPLLGEPLVRGIFMPLISFTPFKDMETSDIIRYMPNTTSFARIMLPASRALEFMAELGVALGDILDKNVGLVENGEGGTHAILFDNSFFRRDPGTKCTTSREVCNYCDENIPVANATKDKRVISVRRDFERFHLRLIRFADDLEDSSSLEALDSSREDLISELERCTDIGDVVNTLTRFASSR